MHTPFVKGGEVQFIVLGRNPGRSRVDLPVTLPHYCDRKHPSFQALVDQVDTIITNPELEKIQILLIKNRLSKLLGKKDGLHNCAIAALRVKEGEKPQ